jgi:diguanylate cyclase (GGDEF)-like protein
MFGSSWRARLRERKDVPMEIYVSIVDSLYGDSRSLFIGSLTVVLAVILTAWKTGEPLLYLCAMAMAIVMVARTAGVRAYRDHRNTIHAVEDAHYWETAYAIGVSAHVALMGVWCVIAFAATDDSFVQFISVVGTISNLIGIAGRNFGSTRLVVVQILCATPLITVALLIPGNVYYATTAVLLLAFFVSLKFISDRLRETLMNAVIGERDKTILANRFDAALNNMPLGLCMFNGERQLVVINQRALDLLGLKTDTVEIGAPARRMLFAAAAAGTFSEEAVVRIAREIDSGPSGRRDDDIEVQTLSGRTFALTFQPMANRGSVVLIEDVTEQKAAAEKIQHLARYDALTGLPNRTFFRDQMEITLARVRRNKDAAAALFIDLDQFKQINDTMGHPFGDSLLCVVAERLRRIVRESDIVARFGGDEFVILQHPIRGPEEAASLASRVVTALAEPFTINEQQVLIGASIGISIAPDDGIDADQLLKNADMALYRTKSEGRGAWRFFEPEMDVRAQARRTLEIDLRNALTNDAFRLFYQPLINLKTRRISTCEALLRWPHPERGMVSPAEFIPVAEEMGLIVDIGHLVLHHACIECRKWPANVRVAVNLSPIQFRRGNVVEAVRDALANSGLPADRLEIEITESVLVQDTEATRACLMQLREMGVRISLDDFGTGYSSLSYLHSFPLHKVKIDRSFLKGIDSSERSRKLLRGVAHLSAELGMSVVVEGVETDAELDLIMREAQVDEAQGYLFSPAVPADVIRELLKASDTRSFPKVQKIRVA